MRLKPILLLSTLSLLQGCLGGGGGDSNDPSTGQLTLTGIEGLSYQTQSQTGKTDASGHFRYYPGETISFSVGDLPLISDVPTDDVITPLEFLPATRKALQSAIEDDLGLLSHKPVEKQAVQNNTLQNMTRFLLALDDNRTAADDNELVISDRVIAQLNKALPTLTKPINFDQTINEFVAPDDAADALSPVNQLLAAICFFPEDDERCETPPTQAEIDAAVPAPPQGEARDPDIVYSDELANKRKRIENAIRTIEDVQLSEMDDYLLSELDKITTRIANRYYLSAVTANIDASDTAIREIFVRKVGQDTSLANIEAISTNPLAVVIHSYSAQTASVEYFIDGETDDEGEVIVNFKPADDYRWLRKPLRVIIE